MLKYIFAFCLLLITPASAMQLEPPAQYVHHCSKYPVTVVLDINRYCGYRPGMSLIACAVGKGKSCKIYTTTTNPVILNHECAHCNGWHHEGE